MGSLAGRNTPILTPDFGTDVIANAKGSDTIELDEFASVANANQLQALLTEAQAGVSQSLFQAINGRPRYNDQPRQQRQHHAGQRQEFRPAREQFHHSRVSAKGKFRGQNVIERRRFKEKTGQECILDALSSGIIG